MTHPEDFIAETCPEALLQDVCKALRADCAALRKNDERYLKVRRGQHWSVIDGIGTELRGDALDAAIDAVPAVG